MVELANAERLSNIKRFYALIDRLAAINGERTLLAHVNLGKLPQRGVYFFFQMGEERKESGAGNRIVRIGTHGLNEGAVSTLAQRLRQHRGGAKGGGNHRGSIFRLLAGEAHLRETGKTCLSWGVKGTRKLAALHQNENETLLKTTERPIEQWASGFIGSMSVAWLSISDAAGPKSDRGFVERNAIAIALLSNMNRVPIDLASGDWLGNYSGRDLVKGSGLWNQRHVTDEYEPAFLDTFERLIERQ